MADTLNAVAPPDPPANEATTAGTDTTAGYSTLIKIGLYAIAILSIAFAVLHVLYPKLGFDEKTGMFLGLAIVALIGRQITKFKGFGIEFEQKVDALSREVKNVQTAVGVIEKDVGPGSKRSSVARPVAPPQAEPRTFTKDLSQPVDPNDPHKGQFGGSPEMNGRRLSARITPAAGPQSSICHVDLTVVSIDSSKPLNGKVRFYLHPTFSEPEYDVDVRGGVARTKLLSYGAFTVGAVADDGATKLELDLVDVPGGTKRFYQE